MIDDTTQQIINEQASFVQEDSETAHNNNLVNQPTAQSQDALKAQPSEKEKNLRYLRERAEAAERRSQELERMIQQNNQPKQVDEEEELDVSDDMYIEGKQFKKYVKTLQKELKATKKQVEESYQANQIINAEVRLKSQYNDFDAIVTKENLDRLAVNKPALYRSIMASNDVYDRGSTAYEMIKATGVAIDPYEQENRRLVENQSKPRAAANIAPQGSENPLTRVGDYDRRILTEDRKEQLRKQVELAKSYR